MTKEEIEYNNHIEEMRREAAIEAVCKSCGQVTTLNMLRGGAHYSANLCQMYINNLRK